MFLEHHDLQIHVSPEIGQRAYRDLHIHVSPQIGRCAYRDLQITRVD
jgi:hypothetical protein